MIYHKLNISTKHTVTLILLLACLIAPVQKLNAFSPEIYASQSVLSEGNWVKVSVSETGIHFIPKTDLQRMGFSDPMAVTVHGYGATNIPDLLEASTYIDDLPQTASVATQRGIYFYAVGPSRFETSQSTHIIKRPNPFTTLGYYYLTDRPDIKRLSPVATTPAAAEQYATSFNEIVHHEQDIINPGETGYEMLGEDFASVNTRSFTFDLPGLVPDTKLWLECSFYALSSSEGRLVISVNDNALAYSPTDRIAGTTNHYDHAVATTTRKEFSFDDSKARVSISYNNTSTASLARLNYLTINYVRSLTPIKGIVEFTLNNTGGRVAGASQAGMRVWDVTDITAIKEIPTTTDGSDLLFSPVASGMRRYTAWQEDATLPSARMIGKVSNQDLHSAPVPDMVIFTHPSWRSQAERIAAMHREDPVAPLSVLIVEPDELYNEFSSGSPDANALRKLLKMLYDRSSTAGDGHRLQYALIMGRGSYDNRRLSSSVAALNYPLLPCWQTLDCSSDNTSYTTDDIYAALLDGAGRDLKRDYQCIGVGRMPVVSLSDATNVVDKLYSYIKTPINSSWKNRVLMVADDENEGVFIEHCESMIDNARKSRGGDRISWNKVYIDAYTRQNGTYPGARNDMFRLLTEGVVWWNFAGHANPTSWTADGLMTYTDINSLYLKHFPFVMAATCDFLRWDSREASAAEILYRTPRSGIIGAVSATRPAQITANGEYMAKMGPHMFATDDDGYPLTIGEMFRRSKNASATNGTWSNANKLRYVLMGDPAMRLCTPSNSVILDAINGSHPDLDAQTTIMAGQEVTLEGHVAGPDGSILSDFTGRLDLTLYDAEYSTTSNGYGEGEKVTFEQQGKRLQAVIDSVHCGYFKTKLIVPGEISQNFRQAMLNMYAVSDDGSDAVGINRDFYTYGNDENAATDNTPPSIDAMYLNHSSFNSGDYVNSTPVLIAQVSDDRSINLSSAGIGHQMLLSIDGRSLTDTPLYYTPNSDGTVGGTIVYNLEQLDPGLHTLRLRVWDTSGNSTSRTIEFTVADGIAPTIYDIYTDANPARVEANFYLTHDRPGSLITVYIEVLNMLGQPVWQTSMRGMSETLHSFPVNWNLTDNVGRRVQRGIYFYRATITDNDGTESATRTRRIAVTAP